MNAMLATLAEICRREIFREKILVVPTLSAGYQLLESLGRAGIPWLNVRPATPFDLALQTAATDLLREGKEPISSGRAQSLVEEALVGMVAAGDLCYFAPLQETGGLASLLYGTVQELRLAGLSALSLDHRAFVSTQKGKELKRLLGLYEAALHSQCLADQATIFRVALQSACRGQAPFRDSLFIFAEQQEFPPLVYSFLARLSTGRRLVLPAEPVYGLDVIGSCSFPAGSTPREKSPLSRLYDPPAGEHVNGLEIFRAYGAANEIREVLRCLVKGGLPLDSAVLVHTCSQTYLPLVHALTARLGLPVTFAEGLPVRCSRPGRLALQLLRWIEEDYAAAVLCRILTGGDMRLSRPGKMAHLLRRARIGWGRDRYLPRLMSDDEDTRSLRAIVEKLLGVLPAGEDGRLPFSALARGLSDALSAFAHTSCEIDRQALEALREGLDEAALSLPGTLPQKEALARLRQRLGNLAFGASGPKPGFLHVVFYQNAYYALRPHTFVVGLHAENFPGTGLQDPVLLDSERRRLCRRLVLREYVLAKNTLTLVRFLASCRGSITLSYPCQDTAEGRPAFPSGILLQAWRLAHGRPDADYSAMLASLPPPVTYMSNNPANSLDADEWWLSAVLHHCHAGGLESVAACYPGICRGIVAAKARGGRCLTSFDGLIAADPDNLDPRTNPSLVLSVTQLEQLAKCPFSYFLAYVLNVCLPDELAYDAGAWLDKLSRGSLLHDIYCRYLRETSRPGTGPDKDRLLTIAREMIEQKREDIPPPSERVYEYERDEILRSLEVFFRLEEEHGSAPAFFEVPFGISGKDLSAAGIGLAEPVYLNLPGGGVVRLRGRIDRIDHVDGNAWEVWDYKTGSAYEYSERSYLRQGRQIQHALYSLAAEEVLRACGVDAAAMVKTSGYIFPTEKGEGQRFSRPGSTRKRALEAVERMLNLVASGVFPASHDRDRCIYCDYKIICRAPSMGEKIRELLDEPELVPWKELQDYD